MNAAWKAVLRAGQGDLIEGLSARFGTPYVIEFELAYFRRLRHAELAAAQAEVAPAAERGEPSALARRGRLRRLGGDAAGARDDLSRALRLRPGMAQARAWLAELDLTAPRARAELARAARERPGDASIGCWLSAALLLAGRTADAERAAAGAARRSRSALASFLLGLARERRGRKAAARAAYAEAARRDPSCSAAHWMISRLSRGRAALDAAEGALDAQPGYAFLAQFMRREEGSWSRALLRLRRFAFEEPEKACWYDRQDDLLYSPFHDEERRDAYTLLSLRPRAAWSAAMAGRTCLRCPPGSPAQKEGPGLMRRAAARGPRHGWMRAWRGLGKLSAGNDLGALADFDACLRLQPCYQRAYAWRGALLCRLGRLREAVADLDRSIAVDEEYVFAYHQRSLARRGLGDWTGASADLERAFEGDARYRWAFASGREPRPEDRRRARRELDRALRLHPGHAGLLAWRGQLRLDCGDLSGALGDLERAVAADPGHALSQAWLGRALLERGQPERAAQALERAQALRPGVEAYRLWRAQAEHAAGERRGALALLADPPKGRRGYEILLARARLKLEDGDARGALKDSGRCLGVRGRSADAYQVRALAQLSLGDGRGALLSADRALYASPHHGPARLARAEALRRLGRAEDAVREYSEILRRHPYLLNEEQKRRCHELIGA